MISIHSFSIKAAWSSRYRQTQHSKTPYITDDTVRHYTARHTNSKITLNIHRNYICLDLFFYGCLVLFHPFVILVQSHCRVLHNFLFLGLNNIHTNTCLPVLDQGWESTSTSWFNFKFSHEVLWAFWIGPNP